MNDEILEQLQRLESLDQEQLYLETGKAESGKDKPELTFKDIKETVAHGYRTYLEAVDAFRNSICRSPVVIEYMSNERVSNKAQIAAGLTDMLAAHYGIISACSIAILIVNENMIDFCSKVES